MAKPLSSDFFARRTVTVARELLGCVLARRVNGKVVRARITETEAYVGPHDLASHASRGRTARTEIMFGAPGTFYVYFVYGAHWMLNVVTEREGYPAAVLIRGIDGAPGPGRLTKTLGITGELNAKPSATKTGLWIEPREAAVSPRAIRTSPRIGIGYAGPLWAAKPYRFTLAAEGAAKRRDPRKGRA